MEAGQLEVVVDNIIALQNLEKMAKQMGLTHELQTIDEDRHTIVINLGDGGGASPHFPGRDRSGAGQRSDGIRRP